MAHFARIENGIVKEVIVVRNEDILDSNGNESEQIGKNFIASIGLPGEWVQTSYNNSFRGLYACAGMIYDSVINEFKFPETVIEEVITE